MYDLERHDVTDADSDGKRVVTWRRRRRRQRRWESVVAATDADTVRPRLERDVRGAVCRARPRRVRLTGEAHIVSGSQVRRV